MALWNSFLIAFTVLLPLINPLGSALVFLGLVGDAPPEVIRSTTEEKDYAIAARNAFWKRNDAMARERLKLVQRTALADAVELLEHGLLDEIGQPLDNERALERVLVFR